MNQQLTTWQQLADALGVSLRWVNNQRKRRDELAECKDFSIWQRHALEVEAMRRSGRNLKTTKPAAGPAGQKPKTDAEEILIGNQSYSSEDIVNLKAKLVEAQGEGESIKNSLKLLQLEREQKELVPASEAKRIIAEILVPISRALDSMGRTICHRANPQDPELAERAIDEHVRHIKRSICESEGD